MPSGYRLWENPKDTHFPSLYQAHHSGFTEDIPFWLNLARLQGDPILELGCGPGRILFPLANAGYTCYGLDNHPGMLAQLNKEKFSAGTKTIKTVLADITDFKIQLRFPLIILPCNTYSTLEMSGRSASLKCIRQHLTPDGIFVASVPNPEILNTLDTTTEPEFEMFFPHPETNNPVQVSYQIIKNINNVVFQWNYDHLFPDGNVERVSIRSNHTLITKDQYLTEYQSADFDVFATYGDFDNSPFNSDSPNLIIVARII